MAKESSEKPVESKKPKAQESAGGYMRSELSCLADDINYALADLRKANSRGELLNAELIEAQLLTVREIRLQARALDPEFKRIWFVKQRNPAWAHLDARERELQAFQRLAAHQPQVSTVNI